MTKEKMFILTEDIDRNGNPDRIGCYIYNGHEIEPNKRHMFTEIDIVYKKQERRMVMSESIFRELLSKEQYNVESFITDNFSEDV